MCHSNKYIEEYISLVVVQYSVQSDSQVRPWMMVREHAIQNEAMVGPYFPVAGVVPYTRQGGSVGGSNIRF